MKRILSIASILVSLALVLVFCKSDPKNDSNVVWKRTTNEVIARLDADPERLNPILSTTTYGSQIYSQIFQYLMYVNLQTLEMEPQLLKEKPVVTEITEGPWKGGIAYALEIHDKAVWDNGTPVTGNDYVFTLKAALNPLVNAPRVRAFVDVIRDVTVDPDNPKKFTVYISEKQIIGEEKVCSTFPVMPEYLYDPNGLLKNIPVIDFCTPEKVQALSEANSNLKTFAEAFQMSKFSNEKEFVSGSGPYRLESWETGVRVVLTKKSNWWADGLDRNSTMLNAFPERLVYQIIGDATMVSQALRTEEIDAAADIEPTKFDSLRNNPDMAARYNFHTPLMLTNFLIYVNTRNPKLSDKRVRKAVAHALDVDEIIKTVFSNQGQRAVGPVHPKAEYNNTDLKPIAHNPETARQLLKDAGWMDTNGNGIADKNISGQLVELDLEYLYSAGRQVSQSIALLMQQQAKKSGINLVLSPKEFNEMIQAQRAGTYELCSGGRSLSPTLWEPQQSWSTKGDNRTGFGNAETDALISQIQVTLDKKQRNDLYKKLQAIIYEEQAELYLMVPTGRIAIHKRFEVEPTSLFPGFYPNHFKLTEQ